MVNQGNNKLSSGKLIFAAGVFGWVGHNQTSPTVTLIFGMFASGLFLLGIIIYFENQRLLELTCNHRFKNFHDLYVNRSIRTDKIKDKRTDHIYLVYFTLSKVVDDVIIDDNVTSYPNGIDAKSKLGIDGIHDRELSYDWIGWTGEESDSNVWKNKFNSALKHYYRGYSISVVACEFIRQEPK